LENSARENAVQTAATLIVELGDLIYMALSSQSVQRSTASIAKTYRQCLELHNSFLASLTDDDNLKHQIVSAQ